MERFRLSAYLLLSAATMIFFLSACTTPQKLLESGDYDAAIIKAVDKLAGKKNKKAKHIAALEAAFEKAINRDMQYAQRLKSEGHPENWAKVYDIYSKVKRRQNLVEPLLPLIDENGFQSSFQFVRVDPLIVEAKKEAAAFSYQKANELLRQAEQGDKFAAREAHAELLSLERFYRNYRDKDNLLRVARGLGTSYALLNIKHQLPSYFALPIESELSVFPVHDLNEKWLVYHLRKEPNVVYDYQIELNLQQVNRGPEVVRERTYVDAKEIEDGFDYVLDDNGNVLKDSLGNDVKVTRFVQIEAQVLEVFQSKEVSLLGNLSFYDNQSQNLLKTTPITMNAIFENYAATYDGDRRALTKESKRLIGNQPLPFPSDLNLLLQAVGNLKPIIKEKIRGNRVLI